MRKAGTGVIAALVLMFSITLFVGSIFYLAYYNPLTFNMGQPSKTTTINNKEETPEPVIIENTTHKNVTLEEAISELKHGGCKVVSVKAPVYLGNPQYLSYNDFKLKALEAKVVIMSPSDSGIFLLVQKEDIQWVWIP